MKINTPHIVMQAQNLSIGYCRGRKIINEVHKNLTFNLMSGEITCLLGPNGAGKSTLLRTLGASQKVLGGVLFLNDKPIGQYKEKDIARQIGLVLTEKTATGALKVEELVALGRHPHTGFFGKLNSHDFAVIEDALRATGSLDKKGRYMSELSDGERQKVMISKALAQESPIIILDEPTSFLDIISRIEIMHLLRKLARDFNKAILLSTHDLEQALLSADKLWLLSDKKGLICGTPEDLIFKNEMNELFSHEEIKFNKLSGSFLLEGKPDKKVRVEGTPELCFWINNFLHRYGYQVTNEDDNIVFTLEALTPAHIRLKRGSTDEDLEFGSFEELAICLRSLQRDR